MIEKFWTDALTPLRDHRRVKDVRIRGSIAAVEIDVDGGYLAEAGQMMRRNCLTGRDAATARQRALCVPPFCTSTASLQRIADAIFAAVDSL